MKTIILFLFVIGFSVGAMAQSLDIKPLPKIDFNKGWQKDSLLTFNNSPRFNFTIPHGDLNFSQKIPMNLDIQKYQDLPDESATYQLRMPVVGGGFPSRMPVLVPDSTVHYFLKIKRIPFVNPLDRRWK